MVLAQIMKLEIAIAKVFGATAEYREDHAVYILSAGREEVRDGWRIRGNASGVQLACTPQRRHHGTSAANAYRLYATEIEAWAAYLDCDEFGVSHHYVTDSSLVCELQRYMIEKIGGCELKGPAYTGMTGRIACQVGPMQLTREGTSMEEAICRGFLAIMGIDCP